MVPLERLVARWDQVGTGEVVSGDTRRLDTWWTLFIWQ